MVVSESLQQQNENKLAVQNLCSLLQKFNDISFR